MLNISDRPWKPFPLLDFFSAQKGNQNNMDALKPGNIPLVSAKKTTNGYKGFVSEVKAKHPFEGHCLTINNDGDGGAGIAYYQPTRMLLDTHVTALYPKHHWSKQTLLFFATSLTLHREKFGHGYSINTPRLRALHIMLPITPDGTPDYAFMEAYIKERETHLLQTYRARQTVSVTEALTLPPPNRWKTFALTDIFEIRKGFYNKKPQASGKGAIPFLGATENNNGITAYYTHSEIEAASKVGYGPNEPITQKLFPGGAIAVTNNGSVGHAYYVATMFTCSHDINPLYLKHTRLTPAIAYFLITCIERQAVCFTYARKWRPCRMVKSKILLPATADGTPDWDVMERYAQHLETRLKLRYMAYSD